MTNKEYFTREEFVNMVEVYNKVEKERQELKAENARLIEEFKRLKESECIICKYANIGNKYYQVLQEIKEIAEELLEKGLEPQSVEHQLRLKGKRELASIVIDLITKAEEE